MVVSGLSVVDIGNEDTLVGNTSKNLNLKIGLFADESNVRVASEYCGPRPDA